MTEKAKAKSKPDPWACILKQPPEHLRVQAARIAIDHNSANHPDQHIVAAIAPAGGPTPTLIAMLTSKYWSPNGVQLTVGFLDNPPVALRTKILAHMNAWSKTANVAFREDDSQRDSANVRITRALTGHWSYLGTDIKIIANGEATMNLQEFTMETPDSEFFRVVRHETGHTLGCPHEHLRKNLVDLIDERKAIAYYNRTQGWDADKVRREVLTPIDQATLTGTAEDEQSIMCYAIPAVLTTTGKPIAGGLDIDKTDYDFMALMYPKPANAKAAAAPSGVAAAAAAADPGGVQAGLEKAARQAAVDLIKKQIEGHLREPLDPALLKDALQALV
jgi:hypothetical protein